MSPLELPFPCSKAPPAKEEEVALSRESESRKSERSTSLGEVTSVKDILSL